MAGTYTQPQKNKLKKSSGPPTSSPHSSDAAGPSGAARLIKPGRAPHERRQIAESRTMVLARQQIVADMTDKGSSGQQGFQGLTKSPLTWDPEVSRWRREAQNNATDDSHLVGEDPDSSKGTPRGATIALRQPPKYRSVIGRYLGYPAHAIAESVTAIEHHWALRATRAEALLTAHTAHRREISILEDRRTRDLAKLNAEYLQEYTKHARIVWISMGSLLAFVFALFSFLYRQCVPATSSRWPGPLHFTIPILSPFASVIEHETSVVNIQLVALLLLGAGGFAFLWFRCAPQRR
ncbi:hypothetical protein C8Q79DRAFT_1006042 [Trametes meyenii]|nr:hypothetical protein C8Q79DRAFT_1006042 [Trametes meyenii]